MFSLQYEVDSKLTSDKDAEDKDVDTKVRAHQQPSLEGDMPVSTVADNIPTSNFNNVTNLSAIFFHI